MNEELKSLPDEVLRKIASGEYFPSCDTAKTLGSIALLAKQNGWIKVSERMPLEAPPEGKYADVEVLVTDGLLVEQMLCASGNPLTDKGYKPWVSFSDYGAISPEEITHWMPLPALPK